MLIENRGEAIAVRWFSSPLNSFQQPRRGQTKRRSPSEQHQERNIISRFADIWNNGWRAHRSSQERHQAGGLSREPAYAM